MKSLRRTFFVAIAMLLAMPVSAQEKGHLNVQTVVQKEEVTVNDAGETQRRLVPAEKVVPGDDLVYTITFTNISEDTAENVVITNPIAEELTYVVGSAFGPGTTIEFSIDGGDSYGAAEELTITEDGAVRTAGPEDFTHIRWTMRNDLKAGAQGMAQFRAKLN